MAGYLRQRLCWDVLRILATKTCPQLSTCNSVRTGEFLRKVEKAAEEIMKKGSRFRKISVDEREETEEWINDLKLLRKKMLHPDLFANRDANNY
jgi:hypothetical protein